MAQRTVFYSWQSDSDERLNRYFIGECLERAIKKLNRDDLSDLVIDRDTKGVPGMVDIGLVITEKIAGAAVVVADLTYINPEAVRRPDERPVPNPNVLVELGYAYGKLGTKAMIGVFNTASGKLEDLPFDLRPKRMMTYRLAAGDDKAAVRTKLVDALSDAIKLCLGDTEDEQVQRNSKIHAVLSEARLFATEIDEWYGIKNLPDVIRNHLAGAQELPGLFTLSGYPEVAQNLVRNLLIRDLAKAANLALNEENWPTIKRLISDVGNHASWIHRSLGYVVDPQCHDDSVCSVVAVPAALDKHIENLQSGQFIRSDLEVLAWELRMAAFKDLIPQHPQFTAGLREVSLELRKLVLRWAKNVPKQDETITAIRNIRARITDLVAKYCPPPTETTTMGKLDWIH